MLTIDERDEECVRLVVCFFFVLQIWWENGPVEETLFCPIGKGIMCSHLSAPLISFDERFVSLELYAGIVR